MDTPTFFKVASIDRLTDDTFDIYHSLGRYCPLKCEYCRASFPVKDFHILENSYKDLYKLKDYLHEVSRGKRISYHMIGGETSFYPLTEVFENAEKAWCLGSYEKVSIITNFIRPNDIFEKWVEYFQEKGIFFEIIISLHTNRIPVETYREKIESFKYRDNLSHMIYVVTKNTEDFWQAKKLSEKLKLRIEYHRVRELMTLKLDKSFYEPEVEKAMKSSCFDHIDDRSARITYKDGRTLDITRQGELSNVYPHYALTDFGCDIPRHAIYLTSTGHVSTSPLCQNLSVYGTYNYIEDAPLDTSFAESIPDSIKCKNTVCPLDCKCHMTPPENGKLAFI